MHGNFWRLAKLMSWRQWWDWWRSVHDEDEWGWWRWGLWGVVFVALSKMADWCGLFFQAATPFLLITFTKFLFVESEGKSFSAKPSVLILSYDTCTHTCTHARRVRGWLAAICESIVYSQFFISNSRLLKRWNTFAAFSENVSRLIWIWSSSIRLREWNEQLPFSSCDATPVLIAYFINLPALNLPTFLCHFKLVWC